MKMFPKWLWHDEKEIINVLTDFTDNRYCNEIYQEIEPLIEKWEG